MVPGGQVISAAEHLPFGREPASTSKEGWCPPSSGPLTSGRLGPLLSASTIPDLLLSWTSSHLVGIALYICQVLIPDAREAPENLNTAEAAKFHGLRLDRPGPGHVLNAPLVFCLQTTAQEVGA